MNTLFNYRIQLSDLLNTHTKLAKEINVDDKIIRNIIESLKHGELSIAVVGEVNRGKSTFLNALVGTKLFPSRASVCTSGVSILDYGDEPKAEIVYRDGKKKIVNLSLDNPSKDLKDIVSRSNTNIKEIELVRICYPNPFTGNGVVLVDTPGVNDPEYWREDITYEYLASADAVIMLLDPMQPLSESEIEFLQKKILKRSIANLIFVVNKIDDVSMEDRSAALARIENILSNYYPNTSIYPLAAKPALRAKVSGDKQALNITGFPDFEAGLVDFLSKGRGGLLLKSKIQKGIDHLNDIMISIENRTNSLNSDKKEVEKKLINAKENLINKSKEKNNLKKKLKSKGTHICDKLKQIVSDKEMFLNNSLKPALQQEPDVSVLRGNILTFQRDCVELLQNGIEKIYNDLISENSSTSLMIMGDIKQIMSNLSYEASNSTKGLQIHREQTEIDSEMSNRKTGAALGGALGAGAGMTIAGTATTIGITSAGAIGTVAAFSTAATVGIGILTGGIGLLIGAGVARILAGKNKTNPRKSSYIEFNETVNNNRALLAVDRFINKLKNNINLVSDMLIASLMNELVIPIDDQILNQENLIEQIKTDLNKTIDDQQSTRDFLILKTSDVNNLKEKYQELIDSVSK